LYNYNLLRPNKQHKWLKKKTGKLKSKKEGREEPRKKLRKKQKINYKNKKEMPGIKLQMMESKKYFKMLDTLEMEYNQGALRI